MLFSSQHVREDKLQETKVTKQEFHVILHSVQVRMCIPHEFVVYAVSYPHIFDLKTPLYPLANSSTYLFIYLTFFFKER